MANAKIVLLTSAGQKGDAARCREAGISAYLVKPVRQHDLFDSICKVLQQSPERKSEELITRHSLREAKSRSRILLTEDNVVNQKLAVRLLEKRGYVVSVAGDGRAAVTAAEKETFDLILMDVELPEMNGFEATAAIRALEKPTGRRTPIIAMTAHAMAGYREKCLAAGMDGYVTKPINTAELFGAIENQLSPQPSTTPQDGGAQTADSVDSGEEAVAAAGPKPQV